MTHTQRTTIVMLAAALAACGGSSEASTETTPVETTAVAQSQADEAGPTATEPLEYGANPSLSVYVEGPKPITGQAGVDASAGAYQTEVVVVNEGDLPADVDQARVWFEVWRGDEKLPCAQERTFDEPPRLEPGDVHTFQVTAGCPLPEPGEYEVRAYLSFEAEGEELDLERYFAGRYFIEGGEASPVR